MARTKVTVVRVDLNRGSIGAFLQDPELRQTLMPGADSIYDAIPPTDGDPRGRKKGEKQMAGRYSSKFKEDSTAQDGRVAMDVGVRDADRGFFRLMTLQKAVKAAGGKLRRRKGGK